MLNAKNTSQLGRMLLLAAVLSTGCAAHALAADSSAPQQNADVMKAISDLDARMERLENRLISLERTVSESQNTDRGNMLADHEARLQALEDQTSKIYGKADEVGNAVSVLAKKVEAMGKDMNMRLTDLEQKVANTPAAGQAAPTSPAQKPAPAPATKDDKGAAAAPVHHPAVNVPAKVAADKLYQQAYDYMKKAAFPQAEAYFAAFVDRFPDNTKAENAYYWLGEVYLVEKRPDDALIAFRNGIRAFPSGSRTPDSLLKMGVAFQGIDKPDLAKATWQKLAHDFPDSHAADSAKKYLADAK